MKINMPFLVIGLLAMIMIVLSGLKDVFGWDLNVWFFSVTLTGMVGLFLLMQGGYKAIKKLISSHKTPAFSGLLHILAFAFGALFIYIAVISVPELGALSIPQIAKFTGYIKLFGGLIAMAEVFVS